MVFFNWATMQMAAKIVYYGPGLGGKTSNLSYIYAKTTPNSRGEMVSLETESDRTLFFDLLPIEVGTIGGFKTRLQLYTVPGQVFYNTTRKLVLKGVDGLVFVADSQRPMREANIESFTSLTENLEDLGLELTDLPLVLQFNKRDLKNILAVEELNQDLNKNGLYPFHEASAINGDGVFETLKEITKLTLKKLRTRMSTSEGGWSASPAQPVRPAVAPQAKPESISAAALARAAEEGVVSSNGAAEAATEEPDESIPTTVAPPEPASEPAFGDDAGAPSSVDPDEPPGHESPDVDDADPMEVEDGPAMSEAVAEEGEDEVFVGSSDGLDDDGGLSTDDWQEQETKVSEVDEEAPVESEGVDVDPNDHVEFDQSTVDGPLIEPPPVKRVHISNQLDILAELEGLRVGSFTSDEVDRSRMASVDLDIDSLISDAVSSTKEIRRRVSEQLNSDVFTEMRGVELAVCIQNADGDTIHTLEPLALRVENSDGLGKLSLRLVVDLENPQ
jgi:signal recognition particle receptor subunit beta